jgi:hypothetical protein
MFWKRTRGGGCPNIFRKMYNPIAVPAYPGTGLYLQDSHQVKSFRRSPEYFAQ